MLSKINKITIFSGIGVFSLAVFLGIKKSKSSNTVSNKAFIDNKVKTILKGKYKMKNQEFLVQLNDAVRDKFTEFVAEVETMGFVVAITESYRTFQQSAIFKKQNPLNATPGFSSHNYGTAIDMVLYKDGKMIGKGDQFYKAWVDSGVPKLAKEKYKMRWGGDFAGYKDEVHFDYNNIYDTKKLYAEAIKIYGSAEKAQGNKIKLV